MQFLFALVLRIFWQQSDISTMFHFRVMNDYVGFFTLSLTLTLTYKLLYKRKYENKKTLNLLANLV